MWMPSQDSYDSKACPMCLCSVSADQFGSNSNSANSNVPVIESPDEADALATGSARRIWAVKPPFLVWL